LLAAGAAADLPRILNMTVPQVGHLPLMALRPFFMVSSTPFEISFLALHLTQYPSDIKLFTVRASCARRFNKLTGKAAERQFLKKTPVKPAVLLSFTSKKGEARMPRLEILN
jgi:hypothetical protein